MHARSKLDPLPSRTGLGGGAVRTNFDLTFFEL